MNMFKPTKVKSIDDYIASLPDERRDTVLYLHQLIMETVPKLKPYFATNMPGYGSFSYKNYKKETIEWPIIALANQKNYISIYVCAVKNGQYVAERYKDELDKVKVGKSCISFKRLEDVNLRVLKKLLKEAEKTPGLA